MVPTCRMRTEPGGCVNVRPILRVQHKSAQIQNVEAAAASTGWSISPQVTATVAVRFATIWCGQQLNTMYCDAIAGNESNANEQIARLQNSG